MRTYIAQKYPNLKIGPIGYGQSNESISQTQATNLINSNPDLLALIPIDGDAVPGALAAVQALGKDGKIGVFGIGDPNPNQKYFANGSLTGLFLWNEVGEGELIAYVARDIYDGTMPAAGGSFTAGSPRHLHRLQLPGPWHHRVLRAAGVHQGQLPPIQLLTPATHSPSPKAYVRAQLSSC